MTTSSLSDAKAIEAQHVLQNYKRFPVVFERGEGMRLVDTEGRSYLDFLSGIGVSALGHAHPALTAALAKQAATLIHTSNLDHHPLQGELANRLSALTGLDRVFFCNSGAEAIEGCLKFARKYWQLKGRPRPRFVALQHSFHGRTMGALAVTSDVHYRTPFEPLMPGAVFAPTDAVADVDALIDDTTAAVVVEPIRGEGGVRPVLPELARAISDACRRTGALLIADEVQSGTGRTGAFLRSPAAGLAPDLVALAKALGGGVPIGAVLLSKDVAAAVAPGDHGTTYGGNPLACRAALTVLEALEGGLQQSISRVSSHLFKGLHAIAARTAGVTEVRGAGLIAGLEVSLADALPVVNAAMDRGLIINRTAGNVIRLLPPYIATERDVDEALAILEESLKAAL